MTTANITIYRDDTYTPGISLSVTWRGSDGEEINDQLCFAEGIADSDVDATAETVRRIIRTCGVEILDDQAGAELGDFVVADRVAVLRALGLA